ncbi:MAG TPA: protein translocase subunit SecF [Thermoanaerobaculia bacterium]|nr:protein translocase subunit SecF [Thermoanaerobaculia bacterium]
MELLRDTNFDFMKYRKFWIIVSLALVAAGLFSVFVHGKLNVGIDFAGGTQINLQFRETPDLDRIRQIFASQGQGDAQIQSFGEEGDNEVMIKTRLVEGAQEGGRDQVVQALDQAFNPGQTGKPDLNRVGVNAITQLLVQADPARMGGQGPEAAAAHYQAAAEAILEKRRDQGLFTSWDELAGVEGVGQPILNVLRERATLGTFAVRGIETVGPQIGSELRRQGFLAVIMSLIGMLIYIWIRFELRFGIGAIMACIHDVLVTLFFYTVFDFEFNLTTIAAFLTLIGYSVNDTVVILDRIRENMRKSRRQPLIEIMNRSINETLSRTILTGGATLLALAALLIWGGDVIRGFAFVMFVGILVGTYSSIYVASPFALLWERLFGAGGRFAKAKAAPAATPGRPGPRVDTDAEAGVETPQRPRPARPARRA